MPSAVKYLSNVTKSVKYAAIDVLKDLNPIIVEGVEENADVAKVTYSTIKNFKTIVPKAAKSLANSQVGELAREAKKNIIEDLKSGKFYNRERMNRADEYAIEHGDLGFDTDVSDFMVDEGGDDLGFDTESNEFLADTMDEVGEKTSSAVGQVLMRTAEYQVEAQRQSTVRTLAQTAAMTATLHSDLAAVNANIAGVVKFNQEVMSTHIENSTRFYQRQQEQMSEQTALLTEIRDIQKAVFSPKSKSMSSKVKVSDIFTSNGMINLAEYFKYVQQNVKDQDSGMGEMVSMVMDLGLGKSMVANPLGSIMKGVIKSAIPNVLKDAMTEFNEAIAGSISTALLNITKKKDSMNPIMSLLGNIFGLDLSVKKSMNTGGYEKGAVPWNGKDHKALTEVIPTLLGKIYSSVSGQPETRYDYETGRFRSFKSIRKEYKNAKDRYIRDANSSVMPYLQDQIRNIDFGGNVKRQQEFIDNLERILRKNFENMEKFNPNDKSINAKTYGLKGDHAEYDLKLIREMYKKIPASKQLMNQNDLLSAIQAYNAFLTGEEEKGDSIFNSIFDGSMKGGKKKLQSPMVAGFTKLDTTNDLLTEIRDYLYTPGNKRNKLKKKNYKSEKTTIEVTAEESKKKENKAKSNLGFNVTQNDETTMKIDDDKIVTEKDLSKESKSKFIKDLKKQETATQKLKVLFKKGFSFLEAPGVFAAQLLRNVDKRLYTLLFNEGDSDTDSVMGIFREKFDDWFENFKENTKNKIDGIKEAIGEAGVKGKFSSIMKNLFGFDFEQWEGEFKEALFGDKNESFVSGMKDLFKEGFKDMFNSIKNFIKPETEEQKQAKTQNAAANKVKNALKGLGETKKVENAAAGMRRVSKTGIVAVSEGEMIIPPDMDINNIKKRSAKEKKAIEEFEAAYGKIGSIPQFAEGGKYKSMAQSAYDDLMGKVRAGWSKEKIRKWAKDHIPDSVRNSVLKMVESETAEYAKARGKAMANKATQFGSAVLGEAKAAGATAMENETISNIVDSITEKVGDNVKGKGNEAVKDIMGNFKKYLPRMAASGATGMALSLAFGLAGGPILGGAIGAGIGLLSKSEALQNLLFGKKLEDGSRDKGILPKDITQNIDKYFPNMAKGAIVGGITSVLPFVPGGPLAGILVGSAVGFARSNENINRMLFGENGKLTKAASILKQKLPKMGLGAAIGMLTGPFGLTTNLMLGAGLGFVSDTEKFKEIVFGVKGFDGKRSGGLVGFIRDAVQVPLEGIKKLFEDTKEWFKNSILSPIEKGLSPFIQQIKNIGNWIKDGITSAFSDHIAKPIGKALNERIIQPVERGIGKIINGILAPVKFAASLPFKAFGAAGQALERRQLKRTGKAAGTAAERIAKREDLDKGRKAKRYTNTAAHKLDVALTTATDDELAEYKLLADYSQDTASLKGITAKGRQKALDKFSKGVIARGGLDKMLLSHVNRSPSQLSRQDYNYIMDQVAIGNYKGPVALILQSPVFPEEYKKQAAKAIKDTALKVKDAREKAKNFTETARNIKDKTGVDVTDKNFQRVVNQEYNSRGVEKSKEETPEEKAGDQVTAAITSTHEEAMTALNRIAEAIEIMAYGDQDAKRQKLNERRAARKKAKREAADKKRREKQLEKGKLFFDGEDVLDDQDITDENIEQFKNQDINRYESKFKKFYKSAKDKASSFYKDKVSWRVGYAKDVASEIPGNVKNKARDVSDNIRLSVSDIILAAQAGDYALASKLANGSRVKMGQLRGAMRTTVNKIKRKAEQAKTVMTEHGPILMRKDKQGNEIPDERDSETKETLELRDEAQNTQKGILANISGLGSGLKGLFGSDEEDEEGESTFSKIFKNVAKYALPVVGGVAGMGLLKNISEKTIQVQQKDEQGNKMYDENGNPIMTETTIGEAIKDKLTEVWLGPDGTGNTAGVWYHVKDFTRNTILPLIGDGIDLIKEKLPDLISTGIQVMIENAPTLFGTVFTGIVNGVVSLFKQALSNLPVIGGAFEDKDKKNKDKPTSESINGQKVTLTGGITGVGGSSTGATTGGTGSSSAKTAPAEGSTAAKLQSLFDKYNGPLGGGSTSSSTTTTSSSSNVAKGSTVTTTSTNTTTQSNTVAKTASSGGNATGTASIVQYSNNIAVPGTDEDVQSSLAYQNAGPTVRKKALPVLKEVWNANIGNGMTVGQLCNDDQTIIAEIQDSNGQTIQLTGADLLLYPDLASQVIGADISLTDEERDKNSEEVRAAVDTNPGNWTGFKILASGGGYGAGTAKRGINMVSKAGKAASKFGSTMAKVTKRVPVFNRVGQIANITGKATNMAAQIATTPMRILEGGRKVVKDFTRGAKAGGSIASGLSEVKRAGGLRTRSKLRKGQKAFNSAMDSRKAARAAKVNDAKTGIGKAWQKAKNIIPDKIDDTIKSIGNKGLNAAQKATKIDAQDIKKATSGLKNAVNAVKTKGGKLGKAAEKAGDIAGKVKDKVGKLTDEAADVVSKLSKLLDKFLSDNKVLKQLNKVIKCAKKKVSSEAISKALKEFGEKILERFTKGLAKAAAKIIAKISTKLAAYIGSAGIATAAFLVVDFVSGLSKADAIMQVEKPTVAERLIAGLVNAFAETFFITLVVDTKDLVQFCINMLENLGVDFSDLRKRQAEAEENCRKYNAEHDTNYTVEEYLMSDHLSTKIKNALGKAWDAAKETGKKAWNAAKDIGTKAWDGIKNAGKSVWDFLTSKGDDDEKEIEKKEKKEKKSSKKKDTAKKKEAEQNKTNAASSVASAATSAMSAISSANVAGKSDNLVYDDNGNVVGAGINEDGTIEQMFIPQGDSTGGSTNTDAVAEYNATVKGNVTGVDSTSTSGSIISTQNGKEMKKVSANINTLIPNMIRSVKGKLASMFGLKPEEMNKTTNVGTNAYKTSPATMFFNSITNMWRDASTKIGNMVTSLPKSIGSAAKSASHFLAVAFGLADPDEKNVGIEDATSDTYINRRANIIKDTSAYSATLASASITGSNSANESTQLSKVSSAVRTVAKTTSSLASKVSNFVSKTFGLKGGSGSGLSGSGSELGDQDRSKADTFISQKYSKYANRSFMTKGDTKRTTVADAGCAPAVATMAVNTLAANDKILDMDTAMKHAIKYKTPNGGVTADYFIDEFKDQGLRAAYVAGKESDKESIILNQLRHGNPIILMGQDDKNSTKKVSPFGPKAHYVVATGISRDGRTIYINDPESRTPRTPYSAKRILKGTILGVAPVSSKKNRITEAATKKAKKILKNFKAGGKYGEDTVQYKVWQHLRTKLTEEQTAAVMGNMEAESGFDAAAIEKGSGWGFGLCQWTNPNGGPTGRRTNLENYAASIGKPASDIGVQCDFLLAELDPNGGCDGYATYQLMTKTYENKTWDKNTFNTATDITTLTKAFCYCWERPKEQYAHMDRRIESAKMYFEEFTGVPAGDGSSGGTNSEAENSNNPITKLLNKFQELGAAFGLTDSGTSGSSGDGSGDPEWLDGEVKGNVCSDPEKAKQQQQLVLKMKSVENTLPYSQAARDPDEDKSGDCSSTVQWAYKKVLGVDPGSWTGAQKTDSDTYTATTSLNDPSKLQLGDLLLMNGHVEMYAGENDNGGHLMIGHGGGEHTLPDGTVTTKGPYTRALAKTPPYNLVRRWTGFKEGGSGSGLSGYTPSSGSKSNSLYSRKWIGTGGSGSGVDFSTIDSSSYRLATTSSTATPASRGSSQIVSYQSKQSKDSMDKLMEIIIGLLGQVVNNTSAIKDISTLLVKLIELKASNSGSGMTDAEKNTIGKEMTLMKALLSETVNNSGNSGTQSLSQLIRNVEAIAQQ